MLRFNVYPMLPLLLLLPYFTFCEEGIFEDRFYIDIGWTRHKYLSLFSRLQIF
jgi:hypothetical protein